MFKKIFPPIFLCISLFLCSCSSKKPRSCDVVVSIPPYLYFVQELTEGELEAVSLVPEGENPHLYEPTPKQVEAARHAKAWIRLSEHFEGKIAHAFQEQNKDLVVMNLAEHITLPPSFQPKACSCGHVHKDSIDLHFWLSPRLAKEQAALIAQALVQAFPERAEQINKQLPLLQQKLEEIDALLTQQLAPYQGRAILVSHPAFSYFCHDYQLEQISIEEEGKDPLPQKVSALLEVARSHKVCSIFTQMQYNNKGAEVIADSLQMKTIQVDPYSSDYVNNLLHISHCIQESE